MDITGNVDITRIDTRAELIKFDTVDDIIVEYTYKLCIDGSEQITLLCSPEHLDYLAIGHLASEGWISSIEDIKSMHIDERSGIASISLDDRSLNVGSLNTCSLDFGSLNTCSEYDNALRIESDLRVEAADILESMRCLNDLSIAFKRTGGAHGCALLDSHGIAAFYADVGRHNAVDKIIGYALSNKIDLEDKAILTTCRISSEILSKAANRRIPVIVSCSAPTDLAVKAAREIGMTLIGFAREDRMNIYSMPERVI